MKNILKLILAVFVLAAGAFFVFEPPAIVASVPVNRQKRRMMAARRRGAEAGVNLSKRRSWFAASDLVYGFDDLESLKNRRIQEIGIQETMERITLWQAEINRVFDAIFSTFTIRNEAWNINPIMRYQLPSAARAQYVDEFGVAKPQKEEGYTQVGLPLWRYELGDGISFEALQKITVEEFNRKLLKVERGDRKEGIRQFLWAIFNNANYTFASTEENLPDVPVKGGANNDTEEYILRSDGEPTTANHYAAQSAAIDNTHDPFPAIKEDLTKYAGTSVNDRIVTFVGDSTNSANIKDLSGFHRVDRTKFTKWGDDVSLVDPMADTYIGMGEEVLGEHEEGILVVRWQSIPANYLVSINLDAPPPIGIREDTAPSLRGLFRIRSAELSGNYQLDRYRRKIGMAPVNRTGFKVNLIGSASYSIPASIVQPG